MTIDSVTAVQYSGYFQNNIRKMSEQGKVAEETREAIFQRKLEEERKRIQPIYNSKGKLIEHYEIEKDVKRKRVEYDELGRRLDIII